MNQKENLSNRFPTGDYEVEVESLWIGRAETDNVSSPLAFNWQCRILTGEFADRIVYHRIEATDENIRLIKEDLRLIGMEDASLDDVRFVQENVAGLKCVLRLESVNNQNHSLTRFISRLEDEVDLSAKLSEAREAVKTAKQPEPFD